MELETLRVATPLDNIKSDATPLLAASNLLVLYFLHLETWEERLRWCRDATELQAITLVSIGSFLHRLHVFIYKKNEQSKSLN